MGLNFKDNQEKARPSSELLHLEGTIDTFTRRAFAHLHEVGYAKNDPQAIIEAIEADKPPVQASSVGSNVVSLAERRQQRDERLLTTAEQLIANTETMAEPTADEPLPPEDDPVALARLAVTRAQPPTVTTATLDIEAYREAV